MGKGNEGMTMNRKPILLDGSAGTALWAMADERGIARESVWKYNIEHPELVLELHKRYINVGSEMIQTNTFSANPPSVSASSDYDCADVIREGVKLAKKAAEGTDVKVYLSSGPLSALLEPFGKLTSRETEECYTIICDTAKDAGADYIMLETFMDVEMMKIAASCAVRTGLPTVCSMTFDKRRRTMMGDTVEKIVNELAPLGIAGIGINCSFGPEKALEVIREYASLTQLPLYYKPNSGIGENYGAEQFAAEVSPALELVSFVGGCCGCDESYIRKLRELI